MSLRDVGFFVRGRINSGVGRVLGARRAVEPLIPAPLDAALRADASAFARVPLLEGRSNPEREGALAGYLAMRDIPFARHHFATFEGQGENFSVDVGAGDRVLVLIAHHDAVPGSPGANDNAASVGLLLTLIERLAATPPKTMRVRFLFTAAEEQGYLGARQYVLGANVGELAGVLSLELCGIGDSIVIWDVAEETPFLQQVGGALEGLGLERDAGYHTVGRIPVFGSDHRAFTPLGVPAYGFTLVPSANAEALRQFIWSPLRSALRYLIRRPVPFDTYHTPRDRGGTLQAPALALALRGLEAVIAEVA